MKAPRTLRSTVSYVPERISTEGTRYIANGQCFEHFDVIPAHIGPVRIYRTQREAV